MAKQLNVNLSFTADTGKARQQLQDLQQSLDKLISSTNGKTSELGLTKELAQATSEASKLKIMLESAMTPSGTLDLGKFSQGLKKSGLELKDYANTLQMLGPEGAKTFAKLAQSITTANVPLKQTNRLLDEFATTMKNTVRWQFSSSMLHGFMGAVSGALGYAKDLDKSLNDIRIVTGYNIDQMAQFATEANKAAKALSSTTTDYTNASLIYYQQGLGEEEIAKRTEVTLKMANAAGVSAQTVSDQMTAVWNNFYDGSKSLEYYADVMTALGAATASSTDEISEGLNKFAAVAETVGLSYEYATAALATVTATTRESADVVGTAFKTLFARIQGLNLGETLDDGTTLNKYSSALAKVGIDIKDTNGNMKDMNVILDEMGAKWGTLAKDQQIALAQTVAGVRQYTQLMALMDNWDYFEENVEVAEKSTGTLKEQAEIYAESWEASSKRVKAAAEGIYDKLLDEQFFIEVNKILEGTLSHVGNLIDGLGGLPGVLSVVSSLMLKAFGKDIVNSMERMAYNIKLSSKAGREEILQLRKDANKQMASMNDDGTISGSTSVDVYKQESKLQEEILQKTFELEARNKTLTEEEQKQVGLLVDKNRELGQQVIHLAQAREQQEATAKSLQSQLLQKTQYTDKTKIAGLNEELAKIKEQQVVYSTFQPLFEKLRESAAKIVVGGKSNNLTQYRTEVKALEKSLKEMGLTIDDITSGNTDIISAETVQRIKDFFNIAKTGSKEEIQKALQDIQDDLAAVGADAELNFQKLKNSLNDLDGVDKAGINKLLSEIQSSFMETGRLSEEQIQKFKNLGVQIDESGRIIQGFNGKVYTTADSMVALANVITGLSSALNMIKGLGNIWSDEDTTYGEKVIATLSSVAMVLPTLINAYKTWNSVKLTGVKNDLLALATQKLKNNTDQQGLVIKFSENALQKIKNKELTAEIVLKTILNALDLKKIAIYAALALAIGAVVAIGKLLYDQYHADAQGAKEAAEQAKVLTERYEELKNKAQELNDAIADYQDARDALADLEKGTDEYAAALENANNKAKELIETYGLWDNYEYKDGVITIDPKALEDAQKEAEQAVDQAQTQMYQGQIYANQASLRNETTNLQRQGKTFGTGTYTTHYTEHGSYTSENYRKLSSQEVQAVAQVASELQASLGGVTPTAEQLIARLNELGTNSGLGSDALANLSSIITADSISGFLSLGESMSEAEKANRYYAEQILGMAIEDKYGDKITAMATDETGSVNESKYNQILSAFTNRAAAAEEQKGNDITARYGEVESEVKDIVNTGDLNSFLDKYENDADSNKLINDVIGGNYDGKINNDEELGLLYAQMISGIDKSELTYKAGNGVGTVKDKEGNEIVAGVSDEVMRREIAKQVAMQQITNDYADSVDGNATSLEQLENALNTLITGASKVEKDFGVDFSSAILDAIANEDFDSLDFSGLFSELDPEEMARLSGLDSQGILDLLGLDAATLQALGYDVDTFTTAFSNALDDWTYTVDTTDIEEKAAGLKEIADDIKVGDIIDQEAYDRLNAAGINANRYFTQMEDGTYKLTGAAREFQNVVENITVQDYINKIKEFESAQQYAETQIGQKYGMANAVNVSKTNIVGDNKTLGAARADYINTFEGDFGFTDDQLALLNKDSSQYTTEDLQELANMVDIVNSKSAEMQSQMLSTADSLDELNNRVNLANLEGVEISYDAYSKGLLDLASSYENCTKEMERYQLALANGNEQELYAAECALKASIRIGEAAEAYDLSAESLEAQSRELMIANGWGEEYAETAAQMAISNQRMNKGVEKLAKSWKDWSKVLKSTDTTSQDYADILVELSDAVGDLVGWYDDLSLSSEFVKDNMELIEKASQGNVNAIIQLGAAVASYEVEQAQLNETLVDGRVKTETGLATNALQAYIDKLGEGTTAEEAFKSAQAGIQEGFDLIANNLDRLQNGASLASIFPEGGLEAWVEQLNAYAAATGMTAQQMQSMLSSVGVTANVQTDYQEQDMTVPSYREEVTNVHYKTMPYTFASGDGVIYTGQTVVPEYTKATVPAEPLETKGFVEVASISMDGVGEAPSVPAPTFTGRQAPSKSAVSAGKPSGGGGSSSSPKAKEPTKAKKIDQTKKEEVVERYKEINDSLDDLSDEYERASRSADRLWGEHRLDALREQNSLIKEQQELLAEKQRQAERYMKQDQIALQQAAAAAGLAFSFDDKGNITNYTDQMTTLYNQLAAAESYYNSLTTGEDQESYEETILEPLRDKITAVEDAIELYEESKELFEELGLEIDDLQDQIMQNNYDIIMEGLELHINFNEEDLEVIDYYLSKIEDDFYKMHEAAALMIGPQLNEYKDNLKEYTEAMNELHRAYAAGEITEAMYQEGLEEIRASIRDNLSSIVELDKTMMEYYGETIAMAQEELAKYTAQMENHVAVLEHYQNLMSILGKETDFNALGIILEGQAKTAENAMKVSKENYEMYKRQVEAIEEKIAKATTDEEKAFLEKEWEAANTAMMEAQQDMLDKTEAWAESLRAILENKLSGFAQDLENALTGGTSFDTLTTSMERAASLQEEYLTTTNQIYETNKLMRTAQQAIDASTSSIAKNKLKQFINETKQLQDQNKLSEYELEIQQAKYNLLLAEMALEDARDAKTVVRLKRDNEGNLGYVYTADQDKLAEAQQELEDAQNSLYNIGLEGANEYSEKYQQTMSEMYDTFTELQEQYLSGEFETEAEYQDAMLKAKEYYYEKLKNYSSLHQVALTTDARVVADAWSSEYSDMIFNTEDWMHAVTEYVGNVNLAFDEWEENVNTITNETLGPNLDTLEDNVKDITDANNALTDSIVKDGGVIDAIESELDQVSNLTGKYATLRQQIQGLIADHEQMMVRMGNEPNPYTPPGTGTVGSSSSGGNSSSSSGGKSNSSSSSGRGSSGAYGSFGSGSDDVNAPDYSDLTKQGVALAIWNGGFGWGNGTTRRNRLDEKGFDPEEIQRIIDVTNPNGDWRTRYGISDLTKYAYSSFDTGGYTGAWGSYGKFAMLHEKELILNPGETENFLASMEVLRSIIKMIDLQSTASQLGGLLHSPGYYAPQASEVLEQNVHIEANFPEVTDRYEIEAALTSIVNRASQFANRK